MTLIVQMLSRSISGGAPLRFCHPDERVIVVGCQDGQTKTDEVLSEMTSCRLAKAYFVILSTALLFFFIGIFDVSAAEVGIKYNRPKFEYPSHAIKDFSRFHNDRINTVMISMPWAEWEPQEGRLDEDFLRSSLEPLLNFCDANDMTVILAVHSSFWGDKGGWTIPEWLKKKEGFHNSASALTHPAIRAYHISFLMRLIDATQNHRAVKGYNILNEPAVATHWYITDPKGRADFDARWDAIMDIALKVKRHMTQKGISKLLMIGNGSADQGYEKYVWSNTGKRDLRLLWTKLTDRIASQGVPSLIESAKWYPGRPRIRTEGLLTYAQLEAWKKVGDVAALRTQWSEGADYSAVNYDYDAAYDYEGLSNAAVPDLEAFYVWRVGSIDGSHKSLLLLDHRNNDRPTPYYFALRDLASGVDSFEQIDQANLPKNGKESLRFNQDLAIPGISKRWQGTGSIKGQKEMLPPRTESTLAAKVVLNPGEAVHRSLITAHWKGSGVSASDSFVFLTYSKDPAEIFLTVKTSSGISRKKVALAGGKWNECRVSFESLSLTSENLSSIESVGFENPSRDSITFYVDDILIRS